MIELTPDADIEMEILCSLPMFPVTTTLEDLADDFAFDRQSEVREILKKLEKKYHIGCGNSGRIHNGPESSFGKRCAWIYAAGWHKAQQAGDKYWRRMYPD